MHIYTVTVHNANDFLILFFSLLYQTATDQRGEEASATTKLQQTQPPNPAPPPNTATQHKKNPKINRNSKINPTQNQQKKSTQPKINKNSPGNPIQKQSTPIGKPRPTEPDLPSDLLPLLPSSLPLLPPNLPLLSSVGGGRRRVSCGGEREGESEREAESTGG